MRNATELLVAQARRHRDRRNLATHWIGVPMVIGALGMLASGLKLRLDAGAVTLAWLVYLPIALWWTSRQLTLGLFSALWVAVLVVMAQAVPQTPAAAWLGWALVLFGTGCMLQVLGHWYEGRRAAPEGWIAGMAATPLFLSAELLFSLGWNPVLRSSVEAEAGPLHLRDLAHPVP